MIEAIEIANDDITIRAEVTGDGPMIICVHGWPELPHSWRHQVAHLSSRGFRVAAIDVRGYGGSSRPDEVERFTLRELSSDVAAVAAALSDDPVVVVGHDWGAPIVWEAAVRHPDRIRAVAGLSVPYTPQMPGSLIDLLEVLYADRFFYMLRFQQPGLIEAEFDSDMRGGLKRVFYALSGSAGPDAFLPEAPRDSPLLPLLPEPPDGPLAFMTDDDLDAYASVFERTGLTGGFNRYRAAGLDATSSADLVGATVDQPSCFIAGANDSVRTMIPGMDSYADPGANCTDFRGSAILEGIGHWVQQEAPAETNAALDAFLDSL